MRYALLIYSNEQDDPAAPEEMRSLLERYGRLSRDMEAAGVMLAGDGLQSTAAATTVRIRGGKTSMLDGPFAETKEQLGGFYLIEAANLDEALRWAERIPTAERGCVEVRPVMDYSAAGS